MIKLLKVLVLNRSQSHLQSSYQQINSMLKNVTKKLKEMPHLKILRKDYPILSKDQIYQKDFLLKKFDKL